MASEIPVINDVHNEVESVDNEVDVEDLLGTMESLDVGTVSMEVEADPSSPLPAAAQVTAPVVERGYRLRQEVSIPGSEGPQTVGVTVAVGDVHVPASLNLTFWVRTEVFMVSSNGSIIGTTPVSFVVDGRETSLVHQRAHTNSPSLQAHRNETFVRHVDLGDGVEVQIPREVYAMSDLYRRSDATNRLVIPDHRLRWGIRHASTSSRHHVLGGYDVLPDQAPLPPAAIAPTPTAPVRHRHRHRHRVDGRRRRREAAAPSNEAVGSSSTLVPCPPGQTKRHSTKCKCNWCAAFKAALLATKK